MHTTLLMSLLLPVAHSLLAHEQPAHFTVAWWNVENFFDIRDDINTDDEEFTPDGDRHWTRRRFNAKRDGIARTIIDMDLPDVVGFAEVENKWVLRELCEGSPLHRAGYRYVHYDSPDHRGIDCALIYRKERFRVTASSPISVSDSAENFYTRDILRVEGVTPQGDTLIFLLNHWPSKRGGDEAEVYRMKVATTLRDTMNALHTAHPDATILAMGDMNATADDPAIAEGMGFGGEYTNPEGVENLFSRKASSKGSYKYQGQWDFIDAMFLINGRPWKSCVTRLIHSDRLLADEKGSVGRRPKRTYRGAHYEGGLSDHLPLMLILSDSES